MEEIRKNEKPALCTDCGGNVPPGEGSLWWEAGPDDGGDVVGRTPAGWRVTHLDSAACTDARTQRAALQEDARIAALAKATAKLEAFEAARAALWNEVQAAVATHGLVEVPKACRLPKPPAETRSVIDRAVYPEGGGFSAGIRGMVEEREDGVVASYGPQEGGAKQWASPPLVEAGLRQYRVCSWWVAGSYAPESYPGPGVPESELNDEERAEVTRLRAAAQQAQRENELRSIRSSIDRVLERDFGGAIWTIEMPDLAALDAYLEANRDRYSRAAMDSRLRVVVKMERPATGRKRAGKATPRPPYTVEVAAHAKLTATVEIVEVAP